MPEPKLTPHSEPYLKNLVYGLRRKAWLPSVCGLALGVFTWFVDGPVLTALIGIALAALPWLLSG